jgi:hypothetical protein
MRERREQVRVQISIPVLCEPAGGEAFGGTATDISLGGCRIVCSEAPPFGAALTVAARLPGASELSHLPAIVRWTSAWAFGIQFGLLGAPDTRLIAEVMAEASSAG